LSRFRLELEYEGTRYSGWQIQRNARTVQGELAAAASGVFGTNDFEIGGAGRTDAGVHAARQTVHLEVKTSMPPKVWRLKINDALPADIHVLDARPVASTFHARHDAISRTYLYQISRRRTAFAKRHVWWIKDALHLDRIGALIPLFVGLRDFRSFADKGQKGDTRVKVEELRIEEAGDLILIRITASHFLWKMVRQVVGVLAEVGRGRMKAAEVERFFASLSGRPAELTAPPSGLFLEQARYPGDPPLGPVRPLPRVD
jgi:tRNA pseudouridine38-40 synthase